MRLLLYNKICMKVKKPQSSLSRKKALDISDAIIQKSTIQPEPSPQQQSANPIKTFPHSTPPKTYRINEQDVYNYVRNSVMETFKQKTTRNYQLVKELTEITVPGQNQVIDRLCKKYSILRKNRLNVFENVEVNIEEITNRYVKSRSKQKQKEQQMARLKVDISANYRYGRKKQYEKSEQFFSFEGNSIKVLERRHREKERLKLCQPKSESKSCAGQQKAHAHPYLQLYEKAQKEVLESVEKNNRIDFSAGEDYLSLFDPEDWQKNKKSIEKLVNKSKPQKKQRIQSAKARMSQNFKPNFYLT